MTHTCRWIPAIKFSLFSKAEKKVISTWHLRHDCFQEELRESTLVFLLPLPLFPHPSPSEINPAWVACVPLAGGWKTFKRISQCITYLILTSACFQRWTNARGQLGAERFLAQDVQIPECSKWHQQPVWAGHFGMHHCPLGEYLWPTCPLPLSQNFPSEEAETPHR